MDIHRCRFVPYPPQSINALAFSHASDPDSPTPTTLRLALGRQNGDVEVWNPHDGQWVQETILRGSFGRTVEQLAWTQDLSSEHSSSAGLTSGSLRLFSTGGSTSVTEWDLSLGSPKRHAEGNFGDIWCFAAQPSLHASDGTLPEGATAPSQLLAAGCGDGTIILFSTEDNDLRYLRPLIGAPARKSKVLSITWRDRKTVVAGFEDSTIRIIDVPNRSVARTMTLGKPAEGNQSVVWTVKCLADGTILSGDSSGELKIWDSNNFSLVQKLKGHQADILDIASSATGNLIFTFGVDRRTVVYDTTTAKPGSKKHRWNQLTHRRFHDHDVKCSASYESRTMSVLVSGGMDAVPIITPLGKWKSENHRSLSHLPQQPPMTSSPHARLFVSWWQRDLMIYHLPKRNRHGDVISVGIAESHNYELLATLQLKGDDYIQSAQISHDGHLLVASTLTGVRLFQLRKATTSGKPCVRSRPLDLPVALRKFGARLVGLSPNGNWLYAVRPDNTIVLAKIVPSHSSQGPPEILTTVAKLNRKTRRRGTDSLGEYTSVINNVSFSSDSRVFATGDLSGAIDAWVLEGHEDRDGIEDIEDKSDKSSETSSDSDSDDEDDEAVVIHGQKWIRNPADSGFPKLDSAILCLSFKPQSSFGLTRSTTGNIGLHATRHNPRPVSRELPSGEIRLVAITATHQIIEYDVLSGKLSEWSRRNPASQLPSDFTRIRDPVMGCFWDCSDPVEKGERLWMYGTSWLFMLDLSRDLQQSIGRKIGRLGKHDIKESAEIDSKKKRRKRNAGAGDEMREKNRMGGGGRFVTKYKTKDTAGERDGDTEMIDIDVPLISTSDDDNDGDDDDKLAQMRRNAHVNEQRKAVHTTETPTSNGQPSTHAAAAVAVAEHNGRTEDITTNHDNTDQHKNKNNIKGNDPTPTTTSTTALTTNPAQPTRVNQWCTFEYRSILGIVVLSDQDQHQQQQQRNHDSANNSNKRNGTRTGSKTGSKRSHLDRTTAAASDVTNAAEQVRMVGLENDLYSLDDDDDDEGQDEQGDDGEVEDCAAAGSSSDNDNNVLEVVIVERPMYDVEQVPRFDGGQDWDA